MKYRILTLVLTIYVVALFSSHPATYALINDYRTANQLISDFMAFESEYPSFIDHVVIGYTVQENPIYMFRIGNRYGGKVLVDGSIHGAEYSTSEVLYWFVDWLLRQEATEAQAIIANNYVLVVPILNIDAYRIGRHNAHNVDLNRNYPTAWGTLDDYARGPEPLSEPETEAMHHVFEEYKPTWYINLHTGDSRVSPAWCWTCEPAEDLDHMVSVYNDYADICQDRDISPLRYTRTCAYAGGTSRDEGYSNGAYSYCAELSTVLNPEYTTVLNVMVPQFIPLMIAVCQDCAGSYFPVVEALSLIAIVVPLIGVFVYMKVRRK